MASSLDMENGPRAFLVGAMVGGDGDDIPPSRSDDVLYFNPADRDYPVSFNLFATSDIEGRHLITSGIVTAFKSNPPDSTQLLNRPDAEAA
jgi:hypothetical protein